MKIFYKQKYTFFYQKKEYRHTYEYFEKNYPRCSIKRLSTSCMKKDPHKKILLLFLQLLNK